MGTGGDDPGEASAGGEPAGPGPPRAVSPEELNLYMGAVEPLLGYLTVVARGLVAGDRERVERASDLVQMTVVAALDNIARGRLPENSEEKLRAWLRGIMLNLHARLFRGRRPALGLAGDELPDGSRDLASEMQRAETIRQMAAARTRLRDRDRQVLDLRHEEKLTFQEIGERLGVSAVAAHKAYGSALRRLEEAFLAATAEDAFRRTRARLAGASRGG